MIGISVALTFGSSLATSVRRRTVTGLGQLQALLRARAHRRALTPLAELDDHALRDIGLLRSDVVGALAEPFHKDPTAVLSLRRREGAGARTRAVAVAAHPERRRHLPLVKPAGGAALARR